MARESKSIGLEKKDTMNGASWRVGTITKKQPVEYSATRDLQGRVKEKQKYCKNVKKTGYSSK